MSGICERCWAQASCSALLLNVSVVDAYHRLLQENDCTAEEQAGGDEALECASCERKTVHAMTKRCYACGKEHT